jgi:hypothetical protein
MLMEEADKISWALEPSGGYSVSSMYNKLSQGLEAHFRDIWAAKVPLKIRIFSWQLVLNRFLTIPQLVARNDPGNGR